MSLLSIVLIALIALLVGLVVPTFRKRKARAYINAREPLSDAQIYERYYISSGFSREDVKELWHEIATTLAISAQQLRPEDRFGKEIGTYFLTSDDLDDLAYKGRIRARQRGLELDFRQVTSVDEYIRKLADRG